MQQEEYHKCNERRQTKIMQTVRFHHLYKVQKQTKLIYDGGGNDCHGAFWGVWWFYVLFLDLNLGVNYTGLFT